MKFAWLGIIVIVKFGILTMNSIVEDILKVAKSLTGVVNSYNEYGDLIVFWNDKRSLFPKIIIQQSTDDKFVVYQMNQKKKMKRLIN